MGCHSCNIRRIEKGWNSTSKWANTELTTFKVPELWAKTCFSLLQSLSSFPSVGNSTKMSTLEKGEMRHNATTGAAAFQASLYRELCPRHDRVNILFQLDIRSTYT